MTRSQRIAGAAVLAAALVGLGGYLGFKVWAPSSPGTTELSKTTGSATRSAIPKTRPLFSLNDLQGKPRSIAEWDGQALVVNFWATWCEPCRREIPLLKKLNATRGADNVRVIGIAVDRLGAVREYAAHAGIDYALLIGEQDALTVAKQFGLEEIVLPFTVFTDNQGRIVTLRLGELKEKDAKAILDTVAAIDRGTLPFDQAKSAIRQALSGT